MCHKAEWTKRPIRLKLTLTGLLVKLANHYTTRGAHDDDDDIKITKNKSLFPTIRWEGQSVLKAIFKTGCSSLLFSDTKTKKQK